MFLLKIIFMQMFVEKDCALRAKNGPFGIGLSFHIL